MKTLDSIKATWPTVVAIFNSSVEGINGYGRLEKWTCEIRILHMREEHLDLSNMNPDTYVKILNQDRHFRPKWATEWLCIGSSEGDAEDVAISMAESQAMAWLKKNNAIPKNRLRYFTNLTGAS